MFSQWVGFPFMVAPGVPHWRHCRSWRCHTAWWGDGAASGPGPMSIQLCTAWWFGTFFIFPYIGIYWLCYFYQQPIIFQQHIYIYIWLVVWNILWLSIYWECHHPNWRTPSFFRGVGQPPDLFFFPDMSGSTLAGVVPNGWRTIIMMIGMQWNIVM